MINNLIIVSTKMRH